MLESKNSTHFRHIYELDRSNIISEFLICINQKILFVLNTFTNQTVLIYYVRISDMFESKNSTCFEHIYKSESSDMFNQNFSCKTRSIVKKFESKKIWFEFWQRW